MRVTNTSPWPFSARSSSAPTHVRIELDACIVCLEFKYEFENYFKELVGSSDVDIYIPLPPPMIVFLFLVLIVTIYYMIFKMEPYQEIE